MAQAQKLFPLHGGYRSLKSFQLAQLIYDITVRFADRYVDRRSRTHDQMVQAARSGVQNIAEGSQASGTSRKMELKLTNVARASLEELRLDYQDFLRQRGYTPLAVAHPALVRFKARRCKSIEEFRAWVGEERTRTHTDGHRRSAAELAANGVLSLLNLCCYLLERQLQAQAIAFVDEGGFTERLYRIRSQRRSGT